MIKEILVKFKSREDTIVYTRDILPLLITDKDTELIVDTATGEVLYNDDGKSYYINRKAVYGI